MIEMPHKSNDLALPRKDRFWLLVLGLAVVFTLINATKPLVIDDAIYVEAARWYAAHPLDPLGSEIFFTGWKESMKWIVMGPAFIYWLAAGVRVVGDSDWALKCWAFPFAYLWVASLGFLLRRMAERAAIPCLLIAVFSPLYLMNFNLMLDLPMIAAMQASLVLIMLAVENKSSFKALLLASCAGAMAALAFEIKYNGISALVVITLYGILWFRPKLTAVAVLVCLLLIITCESLLAYRYGQSSFLMALHSPVGRSLNCFSTLALALVTLVAGLLPCLGLLGLFARGLSAKLVGAIGIIMAILLAGYLFNHWSSNVGLIPVGILFWLCMMVGIWPSVRGLPWNRLRTWWKWPGNIDAFLLLWFLSELVIYFKCSPFPADRRIMGLGIVIILLLARAISMHEENAQPTRRQRALLYVLVAFNTFWGGLFFYVDRQHAVSVKQSIDGFAQEIRKLEPDARIWMAGSWGAKYYMQKAGIREILPDESILTKGDWLLVPQWGLMVPSIGIDNKHFEFTGQTTLFGTIPFSTLQSYFSEIPISPTDAPLIKLNLFRVTSPLIIRSYYSHAEVVNVAKYNLGRLSGPQVLAMLDLARQGFLEQDSNPQPNLIDKELAIKAILSADPKTIAWGLNHPDARSRVFCLGLLEQQGRNLMVIQPTLEEIARHDADETARNTAENLLKKLHSQNAN